MSNQDLPDRIKATLTIDLDFAKEDQHLIADVLQNVIDNLGISGSGNGSRTARSHYSYKLESNLPKQPMTMDRLLDLMDQAAEPGDPKPSDMIAESMHPNFAKAEDWWEGLNEAQKQWFIEKYPAIKLLTKAWEVSQAMSFADKALLQALGQPD